MTKQSLYLIPDDLPPSGDAVIRSIDYDLIARMVNITDALKARRFWLDYDQLAVDERIAQWIYQLLTDVELPAIPTLPTIPALPAALSPAVGLMGLNIGQLEGLLMSSISDIRCNNGVIEVMRFGCCDWEKVCNIEQTASAVTGAINAAGEFAEAGTLQIQDWLDDVWMFDDNPDIVLPTGNEQAFTGDRLACLKASSIMASTVDFVQTAREMHEAQGSKMAFAVTLIASMLSLTPLAAGAALLSKVYSLYNTIGDVGYVIIDAFIQDSDLQTAIICSLTAQMTYANSITGEDIGALQAVIAEYSTELGSGMMQLVSEGLVQVIRDDAYQWTESNDCLCVDYLPTTVNALFVRYSLAETYDYGGDSPTDFAGQDIDAPTVDPDGIEYGLHFQTTYIGNENGGRSAGGAIYTCNQDVTISGCTVILRYSGSYAGASNVWISFLDATSGLWGNRILHAFSPPSGALGVYERSFTIPTPIENVSAIMIRAKGSSTTDNNSVITLESARLTGELSNEQAFTNVYIGQLLS